MLQIKEHKQMTQKQGIFQNNQFLSGVKPFLNK